MPLKAGTAGYALDIFFRKKTYAKFCFSGEAPKPARARIFVSVFGVRVYRFGR